MKSSFFSKTFRVKTSAHNRDMLTAEQWREQSGLSPIQDCEYMLWLIDMTSYHIAYKLMHRLFADTCPWIHNPVAA